MNILDIFVLIKKVSLYNIVILVSIFIFNNIKKNELCIINVSYYISILIKN